MELGPRDRLSQAFVHEVEKGRTIDSPYGPIVHLDLRHLGEKLIDTKLPFVRELCLKYERIDPVTELIPVRPVVHYMMGGVHTDIDGATPLAGLYAAGETACVSINGANRLGSNSLPECLVFGARAGRAAAEYAASCAAGISGRDRGQAADEVRRLELMLIGRPRHRADRRHPRRDAGDDGGQRRDLPHRRLAGQGRRSTGRAAGTTSSTSGLATTQPGVQHRAGRRAGAGEHARHRRVHPAVRLCSARSRAARTSAPTSPRATTNASSLTRWCTATRTGTPRVERLPVTITRWPPGERVYGR